MKGRMLQLARAAVAIAGAALMAAVPGLAQEDAGSYRIYVSNEYGADITVIDAKTQQVVKSIPISGRPGEVRPRGMGVSPDGRTIYVAVSDFSPHLETQEDKIVAVDVETNEVVAEYRVGTDPERLAVSPDGNQLWASNEDAAQGTGFDIRTGELIGPFRTGIEPEGVGVSPDGKWVYITGEASHTVTVIDTEARRTVKHFLVGNRPRDVVFSLDGTRAYVSAEIGGTISVVDVSRHQVIHTVNLGLDSRPVEMALSPDGKLLFVAGGGTSAVYVIDTATNEIVKVVRERMGRRPWGVAVGPDGKIYTANGRSDSVSVIDLETLEVIGEIPAGRGPHSVKVGVIPGGN